jgi:hypothetical protein
VIVYKGTDKDMKCRGFQFELGKEYVEEEAELCVKGFHGCEYPLDVFAHYAPADSRFFVADLDGVTDEEGDDSKRAGTKIKLRAEIGIAGIVKAAVEYTKEKAESSKNQTGNRSAATVDGKESIAIVTGVDSKASGAIGCWLVLTERGGWNGNTYPIKEVRAVKVDGETIKPGVFYKLENGEVVEA